MRRGEERRRENDREEGKGRVKERVCVCLGSSFSSQEIGEQNNNSS